jgi:uncharacterized protein with NAD-binding domain and iron-sulfur cluster
VIDPTPKTKIAILGGGMGAISAAFCLTDTPELASKYDITIYQLGWRIGGKGASGRNQAHQRRNEEHGLHMWFGLYENAFWAMRKCYDELARPPQAPLASWEDAFKPINDFVFNERYNDRSVDWSITFPTNFSKPGDGSLLPTFWDAADEFVQWVYEFVKALLDYKPELVAAPKQSEHKYKDRPKWWDKLEKELGATYTSLENGRFILKVLALSRQLTQARSTSPAQFTSPSHHSYLCTMMNDFKNWFWDHVVSDHLDDDDLRMFFIILDTGTAILCGIIEDDLLTKGFASVDDEEFSDWLLRHGARKSPTVTDGPPVQAAYDLVFGYEDGKLDQPNFAAGTAVNVLMRLIFTYKGSMAWQMQAGMGDTVFVPFYQVLKRRGVNFKFFHAVTNIVADHETREVMEVEVVPQVPLTVDEYDPLILVRGLPCFPSEPLWYQLENGSNLQAEGVNFEYGANPLNATPIQLKKGYDFDMVILGISIAGLPSICGDIIENNASWKKMIKNVKTVMTQAFQLWVNEDLVSGLGWKHNPEALGVTYKEPLSTVWSENQLIERENWPDDLGLKTIAYWCGVIQCEPGDTQEIVTERAKQQALDYLRTQIQYVWTKGTKGLKSPVLDWDVLVDPQGGKGEARFDSQYWRGNFQPSERYVLSVAKSTKHRLKTDQSGYHNLYLVGDWIKTGFDAGCIEAATMSGMQASRAICGYPQTVVGENDPWFEKKGVN